MARFWHTNKEYAQMVYEHAGVWADRATYADDNSEYNLYYYGDKADAIKNNLDDIIIRVNKAEGGQAVWIDETNCLTLIKN
ncbi:MAG: hypothetical protein K5656_02145 [Lachnospiraceae bacterium]|nr:hypothetical protein [Lachnospiraceae bacterium]